jgi:putative aldouronate transport system permease protein
MKKSIVKRFSLFYLIIHIIFILIAFLTLYPFWNLLVVSLNEPYDSIKGGLTVWPRVISFINYSYLFSKEYLGIIGIALRNSVLRTVIGTVTNVFFSTLIAYALSKKYFVMRKFMNFFIVIPMYLSVGLIPTYLLFKDLFLIKSFAVYIIPNLISAYNIIILRNYMASIPTSLTEAAQMDGASEQRILFKVIYPLCIPVLATMCLFIAVFQWSSWQDTMYFAQSENLTTLQWEMTKVIRGTTSLGKGSAAMAGKPTKETLNAAITIVATLPIIMVYPFLQRYFVNGMTLGAVKE